jgi:peptidoglycan/xylan/chitin deacetylase (PgdA/CDA1 family)
MPFREIKKRRVPIFLYHGVSECGTDAIRDPIYALPISAIKAQVNWLRSYGCAAVPLDAILARAGTEGSAFVITIDDCLASAYTRLFPLLLSAGYRAVVFPVAGLVGRKGWVSWGELDEMRRAGTEIGSHTMSHANLAAISRHEVTRELRESKGLLEDRLGARVRFLSLPGGYHSPTLAAVAIEEGYEAICGSVFGYSRYGADRYALKRFCLKQGDGEAIVHRVMRGAFTPLAARYLRERGKDACRRLMGERLYAAVRGALTPRGTPAGLPRFPV